MSADGYSVCPRCREEPGGTAEQDYDFREYYEFYGAEDGTVVADYSGECRACGLKTSFTYKHPFYQKVGP